MKKSILVLLVVLLGSGCQEPPYIALADSLLLCEKCSEEQLAEETVGIRKAADALIEYVGGSDLMPDYSPISIHASEDVFCPPIGDFVPYSIVGRICLFNYEERQRGCPDCAPVTELPSQVPMVHESAHQWFLGRVEHSYRVEEGFCQYVGFDATGAIEQFNSTGHYADTNPCTHILSEHTELFQGLCALGITSGDVRKIFKDTDEAAAIKGSPLTVGEFSGLISKVMGQDALPAFQSAGIL